MAEGLSWRCASCYEIRWRTSFGARAIFFRCSITTEGRFLLLLFRYPRRSWGGIDRSSGIARAAAEIRHNIVVVLGVWHSCVVVRDVVSFALFQTREHLIRSHQVFICQYPLQINESHHPGVSRGEAGEAEKLCRRRFRERKIIKILIPMTIRNERRSNALAHMGQRKPIFSNNTDPKRNLQRRR